MPRNPRCNLAGEIRRDGNVVVAFSRLCLANPIFSLLPLLESLVDSELRPLEILDPQDEDLGWPQATDGQNPQDNVFARGCLREQSPKFIHA
jgi:hypothetical protein